LQLEDNLLKRLHQLSNMGAVINLLSTCASICCTRNRRRSPAAWIETSPTGLRNISAASPRDSALSSQLFPLPNALRQCQQVNPGWPRLKYARSPGSSSAPPHDRHACNSGSQPDSRTAQSEK